MSIRKIEIESGCLSKVAEDEPVFVLRAKDRLAPAAVRMWAEIAIAANVDPDKVIEAKMLAHEMEKWQLEHGSKRPD